MTEIKFGVSTYRGTAEGDHGVFSSCASSNTEPGCEVYAGKIVHRYSGNVYAGTIVHRCASVGVATYPDGSTRYAECDADGEEHGRALRCTADTGNTWYGRYEHGSQKEYAWLYADGTCAYNGEACRADYAPFVALQAMVVPIKARRH